MTAFQQMIDGLYSDPNLGRDGTYTPSSPPGTPLAVRVMRKRPDIIDSGFGSRAIVPTIMLAVRQSEIAAPAQGDRIDVEAESYRVESFSCDAERLEWFLGLVEWPAL